MQCEKLRLSVFRDEARMAAQIFHPHVVEILDHGVELDGSPPLSWSFCAVTATLMHFSSQKFRLTIEQTIEIVTQIGGALHAVHQVESFIATSNHAIFSSSTGRAT